jgi:BirA family biotin operon repressor/biotin-[acetyl-CoA-carboxylase] ligase
LERADGRLGRLATSIVYFPVAGSTNDAAAAIAGDEGCEGAVVIADTQTAGRGRRGREWFSPPGAGLYVSVVLQPVQHAGDASRRAMRLVTLAAGVALAEGVHAAIGLTPDLKWPNDLYVGRRKLAGILAEMAGTARRESIVLGFGINVGAASYPPELRQRATSLESELGRGVDRAVVLVESLAALARRYDDLLLGRFDAILDAWRNRAPSAAGAAVSWVTPSGQLSGITEGIDHEGALLVRAAGRLERVVAGELIWL